MILSINFVNTTMSIRQLVTLFNLPYSTVNNIFHNTLYRDYIEYQDEKYDIIDYI